ncbi:uncharacterized protein [Macrobrachium rosenbergii]|uniref:uncharacterized protein isoform X1 n=1 Tax=Macrobrachium rosenbergii TaxID=79674 RepID=UPI0034D5CB0A
MSSYSDLYLIYDDDRARPCSVVLYQRPLLGPLAYHWALYFRWDDEIDMHCEALDTNGILKPRCEPGKPERCLGSKATEVGTLCRLSPKTVNRLAYSNRHNDKRYNLLAMNCQVWAKQLASDLGFDIPVAEDIKKYVPIARDDHGIPFQDVFRDVLPAGVNAGVGVGVGDVLCRGLGSMFGGYTAKAQERFNVL